VNTYLLEIGLEEMPAQMILPAVEQLKSLVQKTCENHQLSFDELLPFLPLEDWLFKLMDFRINRKTAALSSKDLRLLLQKTRIITGLKQRWDLLRKTGLNLQTCRFGNMKARTIFLCSVSN